MKHAQLTPNRYALFLLLFTVLSSAMVHAEDFDSLIGRARQQVQAGQYLDCLATAQQAIKENSQNYKGYYYAAFALYKSDKLDEAQPFIDQAKANAGSENAATVDKLVQAIGYKRTSLAEIKAGDAAMDDGLPAKAASAYQRAWEAGNLNPDIGMKAASLYADRLGEPLNGARILQQIVDKFPNSQPAEDAAQQLAKLGPALVKAAKDYFAEAQQATGEKQKALFQQAIEADPSFTTPYFRMAEAAAWAGDEATMYAMLKELSKRNLLTVDYLTAFASYSRYFDQKQFQDLINDTLGNEQLKKLQDFVQSKKSVEESDQNRERARLINQQNEDNKIKDSLDKATLPLIGRWAPYIDKDNGVRSPKGALNIERSGVGQVTCSGEVSIKGVSCKVASALQPKFWVYHYDDHSDSKETVQTVMQDEAMKRSILGAGVSLAEIELNGDFVFDNQGKQLCKAAILAFNGPDNLILMIDIKTPDGRSAHLWMQRVGN